MHYSIEMKGQALITELAGEFDLHSAPEFKKSIAAVYERHPRGAKHLIFDVRNVTFIDSSGLGGSS